MRRRYTAGSIVLLGGAVIVALAVVAPALMGQTESPGPFEYIHQADIKKQGPQPFPVGPATVEQVIQGRIHVMNGDCAGCHNRGKIDPNDPNWLAGFLPETPGQPFQIGPFKTYPRNLTPDDQTGLGRLTPRQIFNALRYGLRPGETPDVVITSNVPGQGNFPVNPKYLAPPMPWPSFRHLPDEQLWEIVAYLKHGLRPVSNKVPDSEGPPDFWASSYTPDQVGPYPLPPFPAGNEQFNP
jgi:mono/diheme cytochrome c family protein